MVEFISPILLRLFGVGGQGYLHLLSLLFMDPRDLTMAGVVSRVFAGSYTALLAAIFFLPLLLMLSIHLMTFNDAIQPSSSEPSSDILSGQSGSTRVIQRDSAPIVGDDVPQTRWLMPDFKMQAFAVLAPLGNGVTSSVILAKVNTDLLNANEESQTGSLWDDQQPASAQFAPESLGQSGSLWDDTNGKEPAKSAASSTTASTSVQYNPRRTSWEPSHLEGPLPKYDELHDSLLREIEDDVEEDLSSGRDGGFVRALRSPYSPGRPANSDASLQRQMKMNPQSYTALSEMAGSLPKGETDSVWRSVQWLDEAQRQKSGMDRDFAIAPGLATNRSSLTDLAARNNRTRPFRNGSLVSKIGSNHSGEGMPRDHPSAISLTESEVEPGEAPKDLLEEAQGASGRRVKTLLDTMPDLVAIKIMHKVDIERMSMKKTVENEVRALCRCGSPFVCNIFGAFQDPHWAYLLLEPVPAGDLAGLIEQRQVMFEDEARFYVGCLLLALEHLHSHQIVCLDVKPENLLVDQYGYCKLCDLGIARILPKGTGSRKASFPKKWERVGTPDYMSPEVVCRDSISDSIASLAGPDLWACGILLYELLTGDTPFAGETNTEVMHNIQHYVQEERQARMSGQSSYHKWTSRLRNSSISTAEHDDDASTQGDIDSVSFREQERIFEPFRWKNPVAISLVKRLLQPNPRRRLGCERNQLGAATVMDHPWFESSKGFCWAALRNREMVAPFVPNPLTLAPPFRERSDLDITQSKPLTVEELQQCQNYLKGHYEEESDPSNQTCNKWSGFLMIPPFQTRVLGRKPDPLNKLVHVQKLFKDE